MAAAAAMLFSSITAYAAAPEKKSSPKWADVFELMDYVGQEVYEKNPEFEENVSNASPQREPGTLLAGLAEEQAYAAYVEGDGAFAEKNHQDGETELDNSLKDTYNSFYDAAMALVNSVTQASGTKYVDDIMPSYDDFWTNNDEPLNAKLESGKIIAVETEDEAPDETSMNKGTYWVLQSDLDEYFAALDRATAKSNNWDWDDDTGFNSTREEVLECIQIVTEAYNTLIGKIHEGTMETAAPDESLKEVSSMPDESLKEVSSMMAASYKEEEPETPAVVNEVSYTEGAKKQSTLDGVYCSNFAMGTIYTDEPQKIKQAAGLSQEEIEDGYIIKYFICTSRNEEMNKMLSETVAGQGYKVLGIMNNDLYKLGKGNVTKLKSVGESLTVVLGIPENLRGDQYEFVVMCYDENGALVVMPDLDSDKATITVQAKHFGYWAVGYRQKQG